MIHVNAYRSDGSPILGNMCGQGIIHACTYQRTNHYRMLRDGTYPGCARPAYFTITTPAGRVVEIIVSPATKGT